MAKTQYLGFKVGADTRNFQRKMNGIKKSAKSTGMAIAGAFGVGLGTAAIVGLTKSLVTAADAIGKTSKSIGISAEELQQYQFAARRSGVDNQELTIGFRRMTRVISDARDGMASAKRTLDKLGISFEDLNGKSVAEQFDLVAAGLDSIGDSSTKAAVAQEVFGRSGTKLTVMTKDLQALKTEAVSLGAIMSNDSVAAAEKFTDSMENMSTSIKSSLVNSGLVDWLADVAEGFEALTGGVERAQLQPIRAGKARAGKMMKSDDERIVEAGKMLMEQYKDMEEVVKAGFADGAGFEAMETTARKLEDAARPMLKEQEKAREDELQHRKDVLAIRKIEEEREKKRETEREKAEESEKKLAEKKLKDAPAEQEKALEKWFGTMGGFVEGAEAPRSMLDFAKDIMQGKKGKGMEPAAQTAGTAQNLNALERIGAGFGKSAAGQTAEKRLLSVQEKAAKTMQSMDEQLKSINEKSTMGGALI